MLPPYSTCTFFHAIIQMIQIRHLIIIIIFSNLFFPAQLSRSFPTRPAFFASCHFLPLTITILAILLKKWLPNGSHIHTVSLTALTTVFVTAAHRPGHVNADNTQLHPCNCCQMTAASVPPAEIRSPQDPSVWRTCSKAISTIQIRGRTHWSCCRCCC